MIKLAVAVKSSGTETCAVKQEAVTPAIKLQAYCFTRQVS